MAYGIVWCWECWVRKRQAYPPPLKGIPSQRFSSLSNLWASGLPKMLDGKILCVFYHQRVTCQHQCAQRKVLTHNAQSGNQSCISRDFSIQNKTVKKTHRFEVPLGPSCNSHWLNPGPRLWKASRCRNAEEPMWFLLQLLHVLKLTATLPRNQFPT